MKSDSDKSRVNFILEIIGQTFEGEQVRLIWSAPINQEYTPATKVGQLLLSIGFELGNEISSTILIDKKGRCVVQDYSKQINGKVITYSIIGELIIPTL